MSQRAATWMLWLVLICTLPLPYYMIDSGRVPALQLFVLAAVTAPLAVTDPSFTTRFVAGLFIAQSLLYGGLLFALARALVRRTSSSHRDLLIAAAALLLAALALCGVYRAPLSRGPGATNLTGVFR